MIPIPPIDVTDLDPISGYLEDNGSTTAMIYPLADSVADPLSWLRRHRDRIESALHRYGAVLLRGLPTDMRLFEETVALIGGTALSYTDRSTPRTRIGTNIYTSTEYPPDQRILMHNENSYADTWPGLLFFLCETPADEGGHTPIADSRAVFRRLPQDLLDRFADGVRYTRTYRDELGLGWQEAFQTDSRAQVERYCSDHDIDYDWDGSLLHTKTTRPAWRDDPWDGVPVWFNQANLFHVSALEEEIREALLAAFPEKELPRNAYLGDGSPISEADLAHIEQAYSDCVLTLPWHRGDLLIVANMIAAHGRTAYRGTRRIWVAMA
ncbi:TauD/TfdA family dioxygenase [Nocardia sp. NPDC051990]|uniref:TauD/TfdA family dioxygenase n=1 Tax=Nocardia sp. NPDC051990 TaxID=3155285 RepID=UPI00342819B3